VLVRTVSNIKAGGTYSYHEPGYRSRYSDWLRAGRGRAIAQAVSRQLPTAAARVQTRVDTWDVMDKSGAGAGFLRELRFPLTISIPSCSPQSSSLSPEAGTLGQEWPQYLKSHCPKKKSAGRPTGRSSSPGRVKKFLFSRSSRPALGSTELHIQWAPGLFPRV
jgi:hypothetical protein